MNVRVMGKHPIAFGLVAGACFALHPLAHAQLAPFTLTLGETVTHDDNLLRAPAGSEASDWLSDTRLRLDYSDTIGRNQAMAWAAIDDSRYRHDSQLDNVGHQLGGEFDWTSIDRLSGKIGLDDNSSLYRTGSTGDQSFQGKSILHTQRAFTRAAIGGGTTPLGFEGGVEYSDSKNSAAALSANDANQWVGDLGVSYAESPDLRLSLLGRRTSGRYPNFVPAAYSFHRDDLVLGGNWVSGGFSSLQAQIAYSREDYSDSSARHYWTGFVRGNWQATGHIQLSASWARDTTQNFMGGVLGQGTGAGSQGGTSGAQSREKQVSIGIVEHIDGVFFQYHLTIAGEVSRQLESPLIRNY